MSGTRETPGKDYSYSVVSEAHYTVAPSLSVESIVLNCRLLLTFCFPYKITVGSDLKHRIYLIYDDAYLMR